MEFAGSIPSKVQEEQLAMGNRIVIDCIGQIMPAKEVLMAIVLSQRIDTKSEYEDVSFAIYHFPRQYRSQISSSDRFIYYQGDRWKKESRYYFGCGVASNVYPATDKMFYTDLLDGRPFIKRVPIYMPEGGFYESIDYMDTRTKPYPPWRSSIRPISDGAFSSIVKKDGPHP